MRLYQQKETESGIEQKGAILMRQSAVKKISYMCICISFMFLCTACGSSSNISNEKNEKIHDDIPAGDIKNVNISGNARSIVIKQGTTDNFEFYNADLNEDHQYQVDVTCDEDDNSLNILVTMENADADNDILGSVVVSIPEKEFEKIETAGEFDQICLDGLNPDVFVHTNDARVIYVE